MPISLKPARLCNPLTLKPCATKIRHVDHVFTRHFNLCNPVFAAMRFSSSNHSMEVKFGCYIGPTEPPVTKTGPTYFSQTQDGSISFISFFDKNSKYLRLTFGLCYGPLLPLRFIHILVCHSLADRSVSIG
jgi:hypothetical protein